MIAEPSQRIAILSPHPDDETFGCGGTIKLLTQSGAHVDVIYMTRGERGLEVLDDTTPETFADLAATRTREAQEACRILGVRHVHFLNGSDGDLSAQPNLSTELALRLHEGNYDRVFCPWPHERHPDHQATYRHFQQALLTYLAPLQVWLYEVWTPLRPNICVPIDATMAAKVEAMQAHQSQLAYLDYLSAFRGLASYRSLFCVGSRFAEAFIAGDRQLMQNAL